MFRVGQGAIGCNSEVLGVRRCANCVTSTGDFHLVFCHAGCQMKTTSHWVFSSKLSRRRHRWRSMSRFVRSLLSVCCIFT